MVQEKLLPKEIKRSATAWYMEKQNRQKFDQWYFEQFGEHYEWKEMKNNDNPHST